MNRDFIKYIYWSSVLRYDFLAHRARCSKFILYLRIHYLGRTACAFSTRLALVPSITFGYTLCAFSRNYFSHTRHRIYIWHEMPRTNKFYVNARHHKFKWVWSFSKCKIAYFWDFSAFFLFQMYLRCVAVGLCVVCVCACVQHVYASSLRVPSASAAISFARDNATKQPQ